MDAVKKSHSVYTHTQTIASLLFATMIFLYYNVIVI